MANSQDTPLRASSQDLTGQIFDRLTVISFAGYGDRVTLWNCQCTCGQRSKVRGSKLLRGHTRSCGCKRRDGKHGGCANYNTTPEYSSWKHLKRRCSNSKQEGYRNYGGRGIKVCEAIKTSFSYFIQLLGAKPTPKHQIDRKDNDGHYSCGKCDECKTNNWPMNVRWVTSKINLNNTRANHRLSLNGKIQSVADWAEEIGVAPSVIYHRLSRGYSIEEALRLVPRCHQRSR